MDGIDTGAEGSDKDRVLKTLISLKAQLASAKATIAQQAQGEADRHAESDRARSAALQEAAYYRAKLSAIESGNGDEVNRLERERSNKLEKSFVMRSVRVRSWSVKSRRCANRLSWSSSFATLPRSDCRRRRSVPWQPRQLR